MEFISWLYRTSLHRAFHYHHLPSWYDLYDVEWEVKYQIIIVICFLLSLGDDIINIRCRLVWALVDCLCTIFYPEYWDTLTPYHTCTKIWNSPFYYPLMCLKYCGMYGKQCRPWSDATDLSLHCLQRLVCPNTQGYYGSEAPFLYGLTQYYCILCKFKLSEAHYTKSLIFIKSREETIPEY